MLSLPSSASLQFHYEVRANGMRFTGANRGAMKCSAWKARTQRLASGATAELDVRQLRRAALAFPQRRLDLGPGNDPANSRRLRLKRRAISCSVPHLCDQSASHACRFCKPQQHPELDDVVVREQRIAPRFGLSAVGA